MTSLKSARNAHTVIMAATTLKNAANRAAVRPGLKCEQLDAFLSGKDVSVVLPTACS